MARVVELKSGELPPPRERHAMVIASAQRSAEPDFLDQSRSRIFFTSDRARDIAIVIGRAKAWAEARLITSVYVRREGR